MALSDLLDALERDANAEIRSVIAAGEIDAARIDADVSSACDAQLAGASRAFADEQRAAADAQLAILERRARTDVLTTRAAMLLRIREALQQRLPELVDDALRTRMRAAAADYGGEIRDVPTGTIAELPDGTLVEATLDAILDRTWPHLAADAIVLVDAEVA